MIMSGGGIRFKRPADQSLCLTYTTPLNSSSHVH
jgi:hypothetical protein